MRPTLRQLEYAVAVATEGSFRAAAEACHASQPSVSVGIRDLERLLGTPLFERDTRHVRLTAAGAAYVARARALLVALDDAGALARSAGAPLQGPLRLGVIPTIAPYVLPGALPLLRERWPELKPYLIEAHTEDLVDGLEAGSIDVALVALEAELSDLRRLPLFEDPFVLAVPRDHRLAGRKRISMQALEHEPMLLLDDGHCFREQALSVCQRHGASEGGSVRAGSLATLIQMVAGGLGSTLLPSLALATDVHDELEISLVPFPRPKPHRTIGLVYRRSSPREAEWQALGEVFHQAAEGF